MTSERNQNNPYYASLTRKLVLIIIAVSIAPMILVSGIILNRFSISYHEKIYAHLEVLIRKHKQNIDNFLAEKLGDIRFSAVCFTYDQLSNDSFLQEKLLSLRQEFGVVFEDLGVIDERGVQVAYAGPYKLEKAHYSEADWFKKAIQNKYFISDVFLGLRGLPHFIVSVRSERDGKPWILRATIDFLAFNSLVEKIRIGETGFAFILNREGKFQTQPAFDALPGNEHYVYHFLSSGRKTPDGIYIVEKEEDGGRKKNIYAGTYLKGGDWLLIYQQDMDDAFSDLTHAQKIAAFIVLLGGLGIIITAVILSKRTVNLIAVADCEKEMMNQQVIETGKLASIGELAAGIAHEINNPVAIMVEEAGWIQDLLEEEEFQAGKNLEEFHRALKQINTQGKRCKEITRKLLNFARRTDSNPQDIQLNDMIQEVAELSAQRAKYENVVIRTHLESELPTIKLSPTEIQQVLLNLINNAIDAMGKKGGHIDMFTRAEKNDVLITVADEGPGIPPVNLNRIFDPFFTTKPVGKGTGLGLSICYGIIRKAGGDIEVHSMIDAGTSFVIRIPLGKNEE